MKTKLLCTASALFIAAGITCHAEDYVMTFIKSDTEYSWADGYSMVGIDKSTEKPIPLSEYENGYFYVYAPEGTEVEFKKGEKSEFNDISQNSVPAGLDRLYARGVFTGDESGNFNGDEVLTRAQMTALLARIIGAEGEAVGEMPFKDVDPSSWYASAVYALYSRGIIAGDDYFNPDRNVTREELITMEYRLITDLDGKTLKKETFGENVQDFDEVSEYARDAYEYLYGSQYVIPMTFAYSDNDQEYAEYLEPKKTIMRQDACSYLYSFMNDFMFSNRPAIPTDTAIEYGFDKEMPVITGSTSSYPITYAVYNALFTNAYNHPSFPESHDKTIESYRLLIDGKADIILVPDPNTEVMKLAEEKSVELEYIPISTEALVFFTGTENTAENISSGDIEKIYIDNSVSNWNEIGGPDATFAAFCRNNDSGSHAQMERFFLKGREINADIRIVNTSWSMESILTAVTEYNRENPGSFALGYSMYYYFQNSSVFGTNDKLKLLSIDGIAPSDATLADGTYPLTTNYYAVLRADEPEGSPARKMAEYLISEQGQRSISSAGFGALAKTEEE